MEEIIDCVDVSDIPAPPKIMVIGVGGGGGNAVKYMHDQGIYNVMFMVCNTDAQALLKNPVPLKMQLGKDLTRGLGAGNKPERGRDAALESIEDIRSTLRSSGADMVFVTAGMGGGTGTGAAPIIAQVAKEEGILTVAIVTIPFRAEGEIRLRQATEGIEEIRKNVDSLLIIDNENVNLKYGELPISKAFGRADDILATAAKGIAEIITRDSFINVDFADVKTTMSNSGIALMGYAIVDSSVENIAIELAEAALNTSLLNKSDILGAKNILVNISWSENEPKMSELHAILGHIQAAAGSEASIIWGAGYNDSLEPNETSVTIVATGFDTGGDMPEDMLPLTTPKKAPVFTPVSSNEPKMEGKSEEEVNPVLDRLNRYRDQIVEPKSDPVHLVRVAFDAEEKSETSAPEVIEDEDGMTIVVKGEAEPVSPKSSSAGVPSPSPSVQEYERMTLDDEPAETSVSEESVSDDTMHTRDASDDRLYTERMGVLFSDEFLQQQPIAPKPKERERVNFRDLSIDELEDAPAYRRRKVSMSNRPEKGDKKISRISLKDDDDEL